MNTNTLRMPLAGIVLAGGLLIGGAGIASAETGSTGAPPQLPTEQPATAQRCARAQHLWERHESFDDHLHDNYQRLVALRDAEAAAGHTQLAARLTARLERLKAFDQRVEARMVTLHDKIAEKCDHAPGRAPAPAPAPDSEVAPSPAA